MSDNEDSDLRYLTMAEIMTPERANFAGNIHGGYLLEFLDRAAYACAARYSGRYVVTLSVNQVTFKEPVHIGELVTCKAAVNYVGKSSMQIGIKVVAEKLTTGEQRHTNSCFFTMVAMDENLKPIKVKPLELNTSAQKRRFEEAKLRLAMSKAYNEEHSKNKQKIKENKIAIGI